MRRYVHQGQLSSEAGEEAGRVLAAMGVEILEPPELYERAWQLARQFHRPVVYDSCYVALASLLECELWTADQRLANSIGTSLPWLHRLSS
ncbi:MAG: type II toxin-antitoxin system VapC family toxin [Chloroflexota bacterium]